MGKNNNDNKNTTQKMCGELSAKTSGNFYSVIMLALVGGLLFVSAITKITNNPDAFLASDGYKFLGYGTTCAILLLSVVVCTYMANVSVKTVVGETKFSVGIWCVCALALVGVMCAFGEVNNIVNYALSLFGKAKPENTLPSLSVGNFILVTLFVCVVPAVFEEYIFRGAILNGLKSLGEGKAVLFSSLLFAFYHMSVISTIYQFIMGVALALIAVKSKSIIPGAVVHFLHNFIIVVNYYFIGFKALVWQKWLFFALGVIILFCGLVIYFYKYRFKKVEKPSGYLEFLTYGVGGVFVALVMWGSSIL